MVFCHWRALRPTALEDQRVVSRPPSCHLKGLPYRKSISFPVEIFNLILSEVNLGRDRLVTLWSLAVVSETFLSICQRLLFHDIKISFALDESLVEYNSILKPFIEFIMFLISCLEILGAVCRLVLFNTWGGKKLQMPYPAYTMASVNLSKVISRLKCLKQVWNLSNCLPIWWFLSTGHILIPASKKRSQMLSSRHPACICH